jgi:hypothetical protein
LVRDVTRDELWNILRDVSTQETGKMIDDLVDPSAAINFYDNCKPITMMVDGYLVMCTVDKPWFSYEKVVSELLVVRVEMGGTLKSVAQFLQAVADETGASKVIVGTAFSRSDRALARMYQREGFKPEAVTLTKEI